MPGAFSSFDLTPNTLSDRASAMLASGLPLIDLTCSNFTQHGDLFPEAVLRRCADRYFKNRCYNPDARGSLQAREVVASLYRARGLEIEPDAIFLTASTSESYRALFSLLCDPHDSLLSPAITYPLFELIAEDQRVALDSYQTILSGDRPSAQWMLDEDSLYNAAHSRSRAILSVSPHNPTGMTITTPPAVFDALQLPIISDEVFSSYVWPARCSGRLYSPPLGLLCPHLPVFHLDGISKQYCLPDLKVSWIAMNPPAYQLLGDRLELLNDTYLSCSAFSQAVLMSVVETEVVEFQSRVRKRIGSNIERAIAALSELPKLRFAAPQGGTQLYIQLPEFLDEDEIVFALLRAGAVAHPGYFYGAEIGLPGLVISCVPKEPLFSAGLEILCETLVRAIG